MPTQMGRTVSEPVSFRITMGMLVTGSIIKPRIFISTSIVALRMFSDTPEAKGCASGENVATILHDGGREYRNKALSCQPRSRRSPLCPSHRPREGRKPGATVQTRTAFGPFGLSGQLTQQAIGERLRHQDLYVFSEARFGPPVDHEVQRFVLGSASYHLTAGRVLPFHHDFQRLPNVAVVAGALNF